MTAILEHVAAIEQAYGRLCRDDLYGPQFEAIDTKLMRGELRTLEDVLCELRLQLNEDRLQEIEHERAEYERQVAYNYGRREDR